MLTVSEVFGVGAAGWAAIAAVLTLLVYLALLPYVVREVGAARKSRQEQARPFVVVGFEPGQFTCLVVRNTGRTTARNVRMAFNPPLTSTLPEPWPWQRSPAFASGIAILPPGQQLRVRFDEADDRSAAGLPTVYGVEVTYEGPAGSQARYADPHILDLDILGGGAPHADGRPDITETLGELRSVLHSWSSRLAELRIHDAESKAEDRELSDILQNSANGQRASRADTAVPIRPAHTGARPTPHKIAVTRRDDVHAPAAQDDEQPPGTS
jgi:hypothetical protein